MKHAFLIILTWLITLAPLAAQPTNQKDSKGLKQGEWLDYYDQAKTQLKSKGVYKNNKRVGVWFFYYETGEVFMEVEYLTDGITTNLKMYSRGDLCKREKRRHLVLLRKRFGKTEGRALQSRSAGWHS